MLIFNNRFEYTFCVNTNNLEIICFEIKKLSKYSVQKLGIQIIRSKSNPKLKTELNCFEVFVLLLRTFWCANMCAEMAIISFSKSNHEMRSSQTMKWERRNTVLTCDISANTPKTIQQSNSTLTHFIRNIMQQNSGQNPLDIYYMEHGFQRELTAQVHWMFSGQLAM